MDNEYRPPNRRRRRRKPTFADYLPLIILILVAVIAIVCVVFAAIAIINHARSSKDNTNPTTVPTNPSSSQDIGSNLPTRPTEPTKKPEDVIQEEVNALIAKADKKRKELAAAPKAGQFTIISETGETDAEVEAMIQARQEAKKAKNFAEADRIRDELKAKGIEVTDIPGGAKWKRA